MTDQHERSLTIDELERWVTFGAQWRAVRIEPRLAIIDLCQCTGELVEQRQTSDPETIEYVRNHADLSDSQSPE